MYCTSSIYKYDESKVASKKCWCFKVSHIFIFVLQVHRVGTVQKGPRSGAMLTFTDLVKDEQVYVQGQTVL